ncbi:TonB-dependent receptor [Daejeonella sp.]|uniref:TonB-dependent receptor n=1 Tax=Daejeonella sp. TaxID=2805397 RepID=UPI0027305AAE|nr:TonB-dependent receptor plug domain-containing protein [Daejeonella sp.]MDP2414622.1 hypothetical protein [Daejeonella sp.]
MFPKFICSITKKRGKLLFSLFWLSVICNISFTSNAQQKIILTGTVQTPDKVVLPHVTVLLIHQADSLISSYTKTNEKGQFLIQLPNGIKLISEYVLKVNLLGYKLQEINLSPGIKEYNFVLLESPRVLKEVLVTAKFPVVKMSGDTTTYRADDFATAQDRTIGDVLKKIPGITVENNGQIKFNGQSVTRLYLDGDDLLESKYNIATRSIPNDMVNQIQVLENHQNIKALEGKVFSDAVDINLTFKDNARLKVLGQADAGGGLPGLYEGELNAISLKNIYKAIHTGKLNNTAKTLSDDVLSLNALQEAIKRGNNPQAPQLSAGTGQSPPLDRNRYFFNHSGLANSANLWKLKSDAQLKSKVYYQYDDEKQKYQNQTSILLPDEVIRFSEQQDNSILHQNFYADLILHKNKSQFYLNNKSTYEYKDRKDEANLKANEQSRLQQYRGREYAFSNETDLIRTPKGKTLTQYYSYINFTTYPEVLVIDSLRLPGIFQTSNTLNDINQLTRIPTFFTNNHVTLQKNSGRFSQSYKFGISANIQEFRSTLQAESPDDKLIFPDSSTNQLRWNEYKLYAEPNYEYMAGNFRITFKLPFEYQWIHAEDQFYDYSKDDQRLLPNAALTVRYNRQKGFSGNIFITRTRSAGNFLQAYQGLILSNYRSISQNDDPFSTSTHFNMGTSLNYKNPVKLLFINASGFYRQTSLNTIAYASIDSELSYTERRLMNNTAGSYNLQTGISKYLFNLHSTIGLSYSLQYGKSNQLINGQLYPFINQAQLLSGKWNGSVSKKIRYSYHFAYQTYDSYSQDAGTIIKPYAIKNTRHEVDFEFDLSSNMFLRANASSVNNKNNSGLNRSYFFTDLLAIYKLKKLKADISFEGRNLANVKNYEVASSSLNRQSFYNYPLRSRMFIMKAQFRF